MESQYPHIPFAERLGLRYYSEFEKILFEVAPVQQDYVRIRNRLLSGLEAVQGARRSEGTGSFLVVDSCVRVPPRVSRSRRSQDYERFGSTDVTEHVVGKFRLGERQTWEMRSTGSIGKSLCSLMQAVKGRHPWLSI